MTVKGVTRGNFRLHPEGRLGISEGCITLVNEADFDTLANRLRAQAPATIPNTNTPYYGTIKVKQLMRTIANIAAVLLLTFLLIRLNSWSDGVANAVNAFSQTGLWIWFRSALNVHGAEDEQTLMIALIVTLSLILSVCVVWTINRMTRRLAALRHSKFPLSQAKT